jgi:hypothetical protein
MRYQVFEVLLFKIKQHNHGALPPLLHSPP